MCDQAQMPSKIIEEAFSQGQRLKKWGAFWKGQEIIGGVEENNLCLLVFRWFNPNSRAFHLGESGLKFREIGGKKVG